MKIKELIEILFSVLKPGVLPATDEVFAKIDFGAFPILNLPNSCQYIIKNVKNDGKFVKLTTAFLDRHNDYIDLYLIKNGDNFFLTDGGFLLRDLAISGYEDRIKDSGKFNILLRKRHNAYIKADQFFINVDDEESDIGFKNLIEGIARSMQYIEEMVTIKKKHVKNIFKLTEIVYVERI